MILKILSLALTVTLVASQAAKPPCADPGLLSGELAVCGANLVNNTCHCQNINTILNAAVPVLDALCPADSVASQLSGEEEERNIIILTTQSSHT
jgi:hypothetical protein